MNLSVSKTKSLLGLNANYRLAKLKALKGSLSKKTTRALLAHVKKVRLEWGR